MTSSGKRPGPRNFPPELRERAVKMVFEVRRQTGERQGSVSRVAGELGIGAKTLRNWVKRAEIEDGAREGLTLAEEADIRELKKRNRLLEQENEVLRRAAIYLKGARTAICILSRRSL